MTIPMQLEMGQNLDMSLLESPFPNHPQFLELKPPPLAVSIAFHLRGNGFE
jgi:hypothetical protein